MSGKLPGRGQPCRHCHVKPINRPGGLCWRCYYVPAVRERYVGKTKYAQGHHARMDFQGDTAEDALPLLDGPGTLGRLKALEQRAAQGLSLFGREDVGWEANAGVDVEATKYADPEHRGAKK